MLEAPYVGKTPEECNHEKEYTVYFTLRGSVTIYAQDKEDAKEQFKWLDKFDLLDNVEEREIDEITRG